MNYITNMQNLIQVDSNLNEYIDHVINKVLEVEISIPAEVSVMLVDNEEIRDLNSKYRHIDKETDVLSFPQLDYDEGKTFNDLYKNRNLPPDFYNDEDLILGDVVVSLEKIQCQCTEYFNTFHEELRYMIIHSILHLLGYDHIKEDHKVVMRKKEKELLMLF